MAADSDADMEVAEEEAISFERLTHRLRNDLFNVETTEKTKPLYYL